MSNLGSFENKTVWVTGASSGIGEAVTRAFANHGAKVLLIARSEDHPDPNYEGNRAVGSN